MPEKSIQASVWYSGTNSLCVSGRLLVGRLAGAAFQRLGWLRFRHVFAEE